MKNILKCTLLFVSFLVFISCDKDDQPNREFIGDWQIVKPDNDTIVFKNENSFTRLNYDGIAHSFEYSYTKDSITIQYNGPNMILVEPSTHYYELKSDDELLIDFSNGCYGFSKETYHFIRLE